MDDKKKAVKLVKDFYNNKISYEKFVSDYPDDTGINEIDLLFDLVEHEPKKKGLFGIGENEHQSYIEEIKKLIHKIEGE